MSYYDEKLFEIYSTGSAGGDCTAPYGVRFFKKNVTVGEFIDYILTKRSNDWGSITFSSDPNFSRGKVQGLWYNHGEIEKDDRDVYHNNYDTQIISATGAGGWSRMDYYLVVS